MKANRIYRFFRRLRFLIIYHDLDGKILCSMGLHDWRLDKSGKIIGCSRWFCDK